MARREDLLWVQLATRLMDFVWKALEEKLARARGAPATVRRKHAQGIYLIPDPRLSRGVLGPSPHHRTALLRRRARGPHEQPGVRWCG